MVFRKSTLEVSELLSLNEVPAGQETGLEGGAVKQAIAAGRCVDPQIH